MASQCDDQAGSATGGFEPSAPQARELERIFAAEGVLARHIEGYRARDSQRAMACAVAATMASANRAVAGIAGIAQQESADTQRHTTLLVEAGTGTGKTFAYLAPALLWGGKVIISTGTKHLQDQLFQRDIPAVRAALGVPVTVAVLKGRANYVCHYYLQRLLDSGWVSARQDLLDLQEIKRFIKVTRTGDIAELASVPEAAPIWAKVTSTRENCLGQTCAHHKECFVMQARREAQQADVVVVNHHLFFADVALRDSGITELLPSAHTVIFDEAHQLADTATLFFGTSVSTAQLLELARDSLAEGLAHARDGTDWPHLTAQLERAARELRLVFGPHTARLAVAQLSSDHPLFAGLRQLDAALCALAEALQLQAPRAEALSVCWQRAQELQQRLADWSAPPAARSTPLVSVRWVEVFAHTLQLHCTPLSVAPIFTKQRSSTKCAWIFTSATLSVKGDFTHYATQLGLNAQHALTLPSPFDYAQQALLYVPRNVPPPASRAFNDAVLEAILPAIEAAGGRTFLLCTTLRAVEHFAKRLRDTLRARGCGFPLLVQGEASRTELLDCFRRYGNAILVGSQSFWEGVDVRGDALSLVIIDKLPFAPPDDPVLAARLDALAKQGTPPFAAYQLPQAAITLKQGAGRLIRAETDRGVLMICDTRLVEKSYGKRLWQSLPAFKRTRDLAVVQAFFADMPLG